MNHTALGVIRPREEGVVPRLSAHLEWNGLRCRVSLHFARVLGAWITVTMTSNICICAGFIFLFCLRLDYFRKRRYIGGYFFCCDLQPHHENYGRQDTESWFFSLRCQKESYDTNADDRYVQKFIDRWWQLGDNILWQQWEKQCWNTHRELARLQFRIDDFIEFAHLLLSSADRKFNRCHR